MLRSIVVDEAAPIRSRIHAAEVLDGPRLGRPRESMVWTSRTGPNRHLGSA
jgi:hypothetical protein